MARRRSLSGTVVVDVEIDASRKVGRVTLVNSSSHATLDAAALDAVRARVPRAVPARRAAAAAARPPAGRLRDPLTPFKGPLQRE